LTLWRVDNLRSSFQNQVKSICLIYGGMSNYRNTSVFILNDITKLPMLILFVNFWMYYLSTVDIQYILSLGQDVPFGMAH